jgi:hypothetical protein
MDMSQQIPIVFNELLKVNVISILLSTSILIQPTLVVSSTLSTAKDHIKFGFSATQSDKFITKSLKLPSNSLQLRIFREILFKE